MILNDFSEVDRAMEEMSNSSGSAAKEMSIVEQTLEFKLTALRDTWEGVLTQVTDRGQIGGIIDFLTSVSEGLGSIVSELGLVRTALIAVSGIVGTKKLGLVGYNKEEGKFQLFDKDNKNSLFGMIGNSIDAKKQLAEVKEQQDLLKAIKDANKQDSDGHLNLDLDKYIDAYEKLNDEQKEFIDGLDFIGDYDASMTKLGNAIDGMGKSIVKTTNQTHALRSALGSIAKGLVNSLISAGAMALIAGLADWLGGLIDNMIMTEAEAKRLAQTFSDEFGNMQESQSKIVQSVNDVEKEFNILSKGVNALGENVGLTEEEFERYHEITKIIADNIPSLIKGYDDQGNAIIDLTKNVNGLTEAYESYQQAEAASLYEKKNEDGKYIKGVYEDAQKKFASKLYGSSDTDYTFADQVKIYNNLAKANYKELMDMIDYQTANPLVKDVFFEVGFNADTTEDEFNSLIHDRFKKYADNYQKEANIAATRIGEAALLYGQTLDDYWDELDATGRKYLTNALKGVTKEFLVNNDLLEKDKMEMFVSRSIDALNQLEEAGGLDNVDVRLNLSTQFNNGDITYSEYLQALNDTNTWLSGITDENQKAVIELLFNINSKSEQKIEDEIQHIKDLVGSNFSEEFVDSLTKDEIEIAAKIVIPNKDKIAEELRAYSQGGNVNLQKRQNIDLEQLEKAGWENATSAYGTVYTASHTDEDGNTKYLNFTPVILDANGNVKDVLTPEALDKYAQEVMAGARTDEDNLQIGVEFDSEDAAKKAAEQIRILEDQWNHIDNNGNFIEYTLDEITNLIRGSDEYKVEIEPQINPDTYIKGLDKIKSSIEGLQDLIKKISSEDFKLGDIDSSTITAVRSAFSEYVESETKNGETVENVKFALEEFENTLAQYPDDVDKIKSSIDNLITSYIDQEGLLNNLTEANKNLAIQQLKGLGIANAEELVNSRLNETNQQAYNNIVKLSDAYGKYYSVLEGGNPSVKGYTNGLQELTDGFNSLFEGAHADNNFIEENLDLVYEASKGNVDALNELLDKYEVVFGEIENKPILVKAIVDYSSFEKVYGAAHQAVDSMAEMKSAINSLGELYNQTVKKQSDWDENTTWGFADPETINSIESAFSHFIETVDDADAKEKLSYVLQNFEKTLVEFPGDEKRAQAAMDDLVTAYIDQTDEIKNLTEANKKWTIAKLKDYGVTNAEEVVETRLNKTNKKLLDGEKKLTKVFTENANVLDGVTTITDKNKEAIDNLVVAVNDMFTVTTENGIDLTPNIDAQFVVDNLELIRKAATGDVDAINQLRSVLADDIIAKVSINGISSDEINAIRNRINDLIDGVDLNTLEIGAEFNDAQVINGLNNLVKAGKITRDSMNAILAGIGVTPVIDYEEVKFEGDFSDFAKQSNLEGEALQKAYQASTVSGKITVPKISYVVGSDVAKAHVTPPSSTKDTSGSGDGGGSSSNNDKLNEDTEETFDWIEVKIQRVQEEIERLDKVVGNVYENWIDRNESLDDELEKTAELMKVHEHAYNRYLQNAKEVKVENQPKKDDYGDDTKQYEYDLKQYNEAVAAWKTGEYQKKIEQGFLGDGDIEKIKNKYLVEVINSYKEIYQKAVDAKDAIKDDQIKLGELNRTNFDHIKSEFEELIGYITRAGDHIDEQISRTEEHGYFVSKKYYKDQLSLEQQHRTQLEQEYARLQQAQIDAVNSGAIQAGSEAYNQMSEEIDGVRSEIEASATATVKLNNAMRQLDWDAFDFAIGKFDRLNSEAEFLVDLLDNYKQFNDQGIFNERGWGSAGMYAIEYDTYMKKAQMYGEEVLKIQKQLAADPSNQTLINRYEELVDAQQDAIKSAEQMAEAIKSLVESAMQQHLATLQETIDKYKTGLQEAKSLYEYQKNIKSQTDNIASLQKQLLAYSGDDSEETRATIQSLQKQLEDAQTQLQETEWDKYISETEKILDDMYENYEEVLMSQLDDINALVKNVIDSSNNHTDDIKNIIEQVSKQYGYDLSDNMDDLINSSGNLASAFDQDFKDHSANILGKLDNIYTAMLRIATGEDVEDLVKAEGAAQGKAQWHKGKNGWWYQNADGSAKNNEWAEINGKSYYFDKTGTMASNEYRGGYWVGSDGAWNGNNTKAKWMQNDKGWWYQYGNGSYPKNQWLKIDGQWYYFDENGYMVTGERTINGKSYSFGKNGALAQYASGSSGIGYNQLAWTQENGSELIYRKTDGAMLTPLNRGDMVFTKDMSENLWNLAKNPAMSGVVVPQSSARTINNDNNLTVVLPNVQNYEEFRDAMMKDPKITNYMQAATLGQALGKGKLNRGNF